MKNKVYYILISILVIFSFMNNVYAEETLDFEVYTNVSSTEVVVGTEVAVMVGVKSDTYIHACDFVVESDSNIEYVSLSQLVGTFGSFKGEEKISVIDNGVNGEAPVNGTNIMQITYKINGDGKLTIKTDSCSDWEDSKEGTYKDIVINFTTKNLSDDTTLKSIKINNEEIPNFSPSGNDYLVMLESPNFSLSYETTNPDYANDVVVKMNGNVISDMQNIVWSDPTGQSTAELEIIVKNETSYIIGVRYEGKDETGKNLDNTLKSLKIGGEIVNLQSGVTEYTIKVGKDVTSVKIEAELNDSEHFQLDEAFVNGVRTHNFSGNTNAFNIVVSPINDQIGGEAITYTITIEREGVSSTLPTSQPSSSKPSTSKPTSSEVKENPETGNISMFVMALILISSLVGSVLLYQKNLEGYR